MMARMKPTRSLVALTVLLLFSLLPFARADLQAWLNKPEPDGKWELVETTPFPGCDIHRLRLVSQVWQGIPWTHDVVVFAPQGAPPSAQMVLMNEGGEANSRAYPYGMMLAMKIKAPLAMILGVPNQPLFGGKREDALIAETFVRYLETGDDSWPLLFPMVKSVVRGMDALQEFSGQKLGRKAEKFILTGASKRGWTAYLTAAADARVSALAPLVFDTLNLARQLSHQVETFGNYSEMIRDYTERGLVPMPDTESARKLWSEVDPWFRREKLTMPKMILAGNNDPYWNTDALNLYWDGLPGEKWIAYSPNAGHGLSERPAEGGGRGNPFRAVNNFCAFARHQLLGEPMPKLDWKHGNGPDGKMTLAISADPPPKTVSVWRATTEKSRDFRKSRWTSETVPVPPDGKITVTVDPPESGALAFYADLGYQIEDIPYYLCTQMRVAEAGKKEESGK